MCVINLLLFAAVCRFEKRSYMYVYISVIYISVKSLFSLCILYVGKISVNKNKEGDIDHNLYPL